MKLANGYGTVHKVSGKRRKPFRVRATIGWDDNGKQIYKELGYVESYPKGIERLELYHNNPNLIDNETVTFKELYEKWSEKKYPKLGKSAIINYKNAFSYCSDIWNIPFIDLKLNALQNVVNKADGKLATQKKIKGLMNLMYDFAMANDIVNKKYSDYIELSMQIKKIPRIPFSEEEIKILWENVDVIKYVDTILILIYTGLRINELLSIKVENVFIDKNYMIGGSKTEAGKDRIIPIHHRIKSLIERWLNDSTSEYLIHNTINKQLEYKNYLARNWKDIMKTLNFKHNPHDTRHTFATRMDNAGANQVCRKLIMGHAIQDLTDKVYTHKTLDKLIEAIEMLE